MNIKDDFEKKGFVIIPNFSEPGILAKLKEELLRATQEEIEEVDAKLDSPRFDKGMVHNCFLYGENLLDLLNSRELRACTDLLLCRNAIVYAYQSSSAPPYQTNYGGRMHVDAPRHIPNYTTNIGFILPLDDFTTENGGTEVLEGSHHSSDMPTMEDFEKNKKSVICKAGDAIFFNARLWHRTGLNRTGHWRHALTINFCRPFMRSRFDFPRLVQKKKLEIPEKSEARRYLGWDVRMPTDLDEFYLPVEQRLYKPNQE